MNEDPSAAKLVAYLRLAREWLMEFAPTGHTERCQRLRDAGVSGCRCTFDVWQEDLKKIDAALEATKDVPGE